MVRVAIDAMGGDFGHYPIVEGAIFALKKRDYLPIFVGDEAKQSTWSGTERPTPSSLLDTAEPR